MKPELDEQKVSVRIKLAGLWTAMLFIFAYIDIFGFYRADILHDVTNGKVGGVQVTQAFLALTALYILVPTVMVFLSLVVKARLIRVVNVVLAAIYILTIVGASIGETWGYYWLGSIAEVVLLAFVIYYALKWSKKA